MEKVSHLIAAGMRHPIAWAAVLTLAMFSNLSQAHDQNEAVAALIMLTFFAALVSAKMVQIAHVAWETRRSPTMIWFLGINTLLIVLLALSGTLLLCGTLISSWHQYMPLFFSLVRAVVTCALIGALVVNTAEVERETWTVILGKVAFAILVATGAYIGLRAALSM